MTIFFFSFFFRSGGDFDTPFPPQTESRPSTHSTRIVSVLVPSLIPDRYPDRCLPLVSLDEGQVVYTGENIGDLVGMSEDRSSDRSLPRTGWNRPFTVKELGGLL